MIMSLFLLIRCLYFHFHIALFVDASGIVHVMLDLLVIGFVIRLDRQCGCVILNAESLSKTILESLVCF